MQRTLGLLLRPIALVAIALLSCAAAQGATTYPSLPSSGTSARDFVPPGWHLLTSASGDLNDDARTDVAMVIESDAVMMENRGRDDGPGVTAAKGRILVVLFREPGTRRYRLATRHDTFILRSNEGSRFDPFQELRIDDGALVIPFYGGASRRFNAAYRFRYRSDDFVLVGADRTDYDARSGEFESRSFDFLGGRMKVTTGNLYDDLERDHITWRRIPTGEVKTLKTLTTPFNWEIEKNVYL